MSARLLRETLCTRPLELSCWECAGPYFTDTRFLSRKYREFKLVKRTACSSFAQHLMHIYNDFLFGSRMPSPCFHFLAVHTVVPRKTSATCLSRETTRDPSTSDVEPLFFHSPVIFFWKIVSSKVGRKKNALRRQQFPRRRQRQGSKKHFETLPLDYSRHT